ncbi:hypothetical protein GCM10029992_44000 [Glycomyces albus]
MGRTGRRREGSRPRRPRLRRRPVGRRLLGARTALLRGAYRDQPETSGSRYLTAADIRDHLQDCHRHQMPAAFHAIGDGAIETVLDGLDLAAETIDLEDVRHARHRIEHAELLDSDLIARMVHYGLHASVQPAFDAAWGGRDGMYATRLGVQTAMDSNPFAGLAGVGVPWRSDPTPRSPPSTRGAASPPPSDTIATDPA